LEFNFVLQNNEVALLYLRLRHQLNPFKSASQLDNEVFANVLNNEHIEASHKEQFWVQATT
jgi:hypothetical protein